MLSKEFIFTGREVINDKFMVFLQQYATISMEYAQFKFLIEKANLIYRQCKRCGHDKLANAGFSNDGMRLRKFKCKNCNLYSVQSKKLLRKDKLLLG